MTFPVEGLRSEFQGFAADEVARLVDEAEVFAPLPPAARTFIAARLEPRALAGGDVLIREGDHADSLYVIAVGRLRVTIDRDGGGHKVLAELGRGDVVGEMAMITNEPRSATVTAVRDSQILRLPTDAFVQLVREHPDALRELTTQIVRRLVRSLREGTPTSPVVTIAVVPLSRDDHVMQLDERLHAALDRLTGASSHVTVAATTAALGDLARVGSDRLASWFAEHETGFDVVVYEADAEPTEWTDACIRQADLILLAGAAGSSTALRPVERAIAERRRHMPCRQQLVIVHPPGTGDPRRTRLWLEPRAVEKHHHIAADRDSDMERLARMLLGRGIGVVFSGGGARGVANIGVLQALHELGVPIDAVGGASIGSIIAGWAARGQTAAEIAHQLRRAVVDTSPFDVTFPAISLAAGRRVTRHLREGAHGLDIEDAWLSLFCVSTNLTRGEVEIHRRGPIWHAVRASFSIPGVFPPVRNADGDLLVDGGVLDNLPVGVMRAEHDGITVIAADVGQTRDLSAGALPGDGVVSGWEVLLRRLDPGSPDRGNVGLARILMRLTELGGKQTEDRGDLYIRPTVDDFGIADFKAFNRLVARGHQAGTRAVRDWTENGGSIARHAEGSRVRSTAKRGAAH